MALSKINPTKQPSWKKLVQQFNKENNFHINDFFKEENNRLDEFCINWENFYVDFSKNRLSNNSFKLLTDLCKETNLKNNIKKYFNGSIINETENRAVLHTALRSSENDEVNKTLKKIINISDEINSAKRLGYSGKKITDVVNIGIGGSHLGPEMVTEALLNYSQGIKPHFISNIDPDFTSKLLEKLNPETTIFIIVSKTFSTIETLKMQIKLEHGLLKMQVKIP